MNDFDAALRQAVLDGFEPVTPSPKKRVKKSSVKAGPGGIAIGTIKIKGGTPDQVAELLHKIKNQPYSRTG
ncbi:hypothetical protein [Parvibium lacunae]|uniref:Uncharacterized protein n=1 Tax=Parvibium lacunae TaxID=1888893 RepID=A0A368L7U0_9BURK|nr:hypothetical protein [Parvibium lacunae]RCS59735.1 hypothetical protein DU000_03230 [Parvibium lacunae]